MIGNRDVDRIDAVALAYRASRRQSRYKRALGNRLAAFLRESSDRRRTMPQPRMSGWVMNSSRSCSPRRAVPIDAWRNFRPAAARADELRMNGAMTLAVAACLRNPRLVGLNIRDLFPCMNKVKQGGLLARVNAVPKFTPAIITDPGFTVLPVSAASRSFKQPLRIEPGVYHQQFAGRRSWRRCWCLQTPCRWNKTTTHMSQTAQLTTCCRQRARIIVLGLMGQLGTLARRIAQGRVCEYAVANKRQASGHIGQGRENSLAAYPAALRSPHRR